MAWLVTALVLQSAHDKSISLFQDVTSNHPSRNDMYVRYPLSLRQVEDILHEGGIDFSYETIRAWWNRLGPVFATEIRKSRAAPSQYLEQWRWYLDEVLVRINSETFYQWREVDHEGEILEAFVTKRRNRRAALKVLSH